jgi:hypothetical protein
MDFCFVHFFTNFSGFCMYFDTFFGGFCLKQVYQRDQEFSFHVMDFVGMGFGQFFRRVLYLRDEEGEFFFPFLTRTPYDVFCAF